MSRIFTLNTANYMSLGANAVGPKLAGASGGSVHAIFKAATFAGYNDIFHAFNGAGAGALLASIGSSGLGWQAFAAYRTADGYGNGLAPGTGPTANVWTAFGFSVNWTGNPYSFKMYKDGSSIGTGSTYTTGSPGGTYTHTSTTETDSIGGYTSGGVPAGTNRQIDGPIAMVGVWSKVLTDGDFIALGSGLSPLRVQPQFLVEYWALNGQGSPEPGIINRIQGTITGSIPVGDHPRIFGL